MTGRERVSEHLDDGRRYRLRESGGAVATVERHDLGGWTLLDEREAAAVVARLRRPRPETPD